MKMKNKRVVISGTVGVGKSTVAEIVKEKLELKGYEVNLLKEETINSPYLSNFYSNPKQWAFVAQLDFVMERFKQWLVDEKYRSESSNDKLITLYDRHFIDDYLFAELHSVDENINQLNSIVYHTIYKELIDKMIESNAIPNKIYLLEADLKTVVNRLTNRNRSVEIDTKDKYWKDLYNSYYNKPKFKHHFKKYSEEVVQIDTENKKPELIADEIIENILS